MGAPELWIVAGPNGAGKSSTATPLVRKRVPEVLDPDKICRVIHDRFPRFAPRIAPTLCRQFANWLAVESVERRVATAIHTRRSIAVETVLSTPKYEKHVRSAKAKGFTVMMVYVALPDPELHVLRVATRVQAQGHDVAKDKIRQRWERSHRMLERFEPLLDGLMVFDNSAFAKDDTPSPTLVAEKQLGSQNVILHAPNVLPRVTEALSSAVLRHGSG